MLPVTPASFPAGPLTVDRGHREGHGSLSKPGVGRLPEKGQRVSVSGSAGQSPWQPCDCCLAEAAPGSRGTQLSRWTLRFEFYVIFAGHEMLLLL